MVYLAGKMTGLTKEEMSAWRNGAKTLLAGKFAVLNPVDIQLSTWLTDREIVDSNKFQILNSDIVLAEMNFPDVSIGTIGEIVFARLNNKPVIAWGRAGFVTNPWIREHITIHFQDLKSAVNYIMENYQIPR